MISANCGLILIFILLRDSREMTLCFICAGEQVLPFEKIFLVVCLGISAAKLCFPGEKPEMIKSKTLKGVTRGWKTWGEGGREGGSYNDFL